ncbi:hypothetical protein ACWD6I_02735 [Streptomyces sp. NPDC002454]
MNRSVEDTLRAVVDALERRALADRTEALPALRSVRALLANDEAEIAVDYLVNTLNAFRLALRQDEYGCLVTAAGLLDQADTVTDLDPRLLRPASEGR